jgi:hypothetical protein
MRTLIQHDPVARVQVLVGVGPNHEIVIVPRLDHAETAKPPALDNLAHFSDRRIETVRMAAEELDAVLFRRRVHRFAFVDRERHRLLDDHVFAVLGGGDRVAGVHLVRRGDVNRVDVGALHQLFQSLVNLAAEFFAEFFPRARARIGRGRDADLR